jgi:hypothetical protein
VQERTKEEEEKEGGKKSLKKELKEAESVCHMDSS